jgi:hypothetical protein
VEDSNVLEPARTSPVESPAAAPKADVRPGRPHLVVVNTRGVHPDDEAGPSAVLVTSFWHPRDRRLSQNFFESLEHAIRLFVDESGWVLVQQQHLTQEHEHELIFEARQEDFQGPSREQILEEVGLTPEDVKKLLDEAGPPQSP